MVLRLCQLFIKVMFVGAVYFPDLSFDPVPVDCGLKISLADTDQDLCRKFSFRRSYQPEYFKRISVKGNSFIEEPVDQLFFSQYFIFPEGEEGHIGITSIFSGFSAGTLQ